MLVMPCSAINYSVKGFIAESTTDRSQRNSAAEFRVGPPFKRAMASSSTNAGKGAAEEPEPEPGGASSSSSTTSYNPHEYQRPHPDDRDGGGPATKATKGKKATEGGGKSGAAGVAGKKDGAALGRCGNCDAEGATRKCTQCGTEVYCDEKCQKVSRGG